MESITLAAKVEAAEKIVRVVRIMSTLIAACSHSKASPVKSLLVLLVTSSVSMAQLPFAIDPESPPTLTREDFEKTGKFFSGRAEGLHLSSGER